MHMQKGSWHSSLKKYAQLVFLVLMLLLGWVFVSIFRLIKGGEWSQGRQVAFDKNNLLGVTSAHADIPPPVGSTPFLAAWNGKEYKIENDFLFGKPRSHFPDFAEGRRNYEAGWVSPDLYKIQNAFQKRNGKLAFQIQENEPEESFINGLTLLRAVHPVKSEIMVDSDYAKFYAFDKENFLRSFIKPVSVKSKDGENVSYLANSDNLYGTPSRELPLDERDYVDVAFSGISSGKKYFLVTKSHYRDWMMGENPSLLTWVQFYVKSFAQSPILSKTFMASSLLFIPWLHKKGLIAPLVMLGGGGSAGSGGSTAGCCLPAFFRDSYGQYRQFTTIEPRTWQSSAEMKEIPQEAVSDSGELSLRILATKRHRLDFVGLVRNPEETPYQMETLSVKEAKHNRLQEDVTALLRYRAGSYLHTIPGDTVDIEFELPKSTTPRNMRETYLLRSSGFYTYLSPESKKIAGDWEQKLSNEARERLVLVRSKNNVA